MSLSSTILGFMKFIFSLAKHLSIDKSFYRKNTRLQSQFHFMNTQSSKILFDRKTRMTTSIKAKLNKSDLQTNNHKYRIMKQS